MQYMQCIYEDTVDTYKLPNWQFNYVLASIEAVTTNSNTKATKQTEQSIFTFTSVESTKEVKLSLTEFFNRHPLLLLLLTLTSSILVQSNVPIIK